MARIYSRGVKTVELPFLMSCALYLLDRRYWIVGVRYPWYGTRFDLVVRDPSLSAQVGLVEVKYRGDERPVRPYEVERFRKELLRVAYAGASYHRLALFMTNTRFSEEARKLADEYGIRTMENVPVLFRLTDVGREKRDRWEAEEKVTKGHHQL